MRVAFIFPPTAGFQDRLKGKTPDELFAMFETLYKDKRVERRVGWSSTPGEFAEFRRLLRQPFTTTYKVPPGGINRYVVEFTITPKVEASMSHIQEIVARVYEKARRVPS